MSQIVCCGEIDVLFWMLVSGDILMYTDESLSHEKKQRKIITYEDGTEE
jgi:hypothetical protein